MQHRKWEKNWKKAIILPGRHTKTTYQTEKNHLQLPPPQDLRLVWVGGDLVHQNRDIVFRLVIQAVLNLRRCQQHKKQKKQKTKKQKQ